MQIKDIKDLEKVMKLCRKNGVTSFKIDGIEFLMAAQATKTKAPAASSFNPFDMGPVPPAVRLPDMPEEVVNADRIQSDALTDEQLLFMSAEPEILEQKG